MLDIEGTPTLTSLFGTSRPLGKRVFDKIGCLRAVGSPGIINSVFWGWLIWSTGLQLSRVYSHTVGDVGDCVRNTAAECCHSEARAQIRSSITSHVILMMRWRIGMWIWIDWMLKRRIVNNTTLTLVALADTLTKYPYPPSVGIMFSSLHFIIAWLTPNTTKTARETQDEIVISDMHWKVVHVSPSAAIDRLYSSR